MIGISLFGQEFWGISSGPCTPH